MSCAQPEYYGMLATGHSMDGVTWIAVGVVSLPFRAMAVLTRVMDSAYEQPPSSCSSCDPSLAS